MKTKHLLLTGALALGALGAGAQTIRYVDDIATGANDGTSWEDAYQTLQAAINASSSGDQVWVKQGTHKPHASDETVSFALKDGVSVYGGFSQSLTGTSGSLSSADPAQYPTYLSGDLDSDGLDADNSLHVVEAPGALTANISFDGFIVTMGYADGTSGTTDVESRGAGLYSLYSSGSADLIISRCTFIDNWANQSGAGLYSEGIRDLVVDKCLFEDNLQNSSTNDARYGGSALTIINPAVGTVDATIKNTIFRDNTSTRQGALKIHNAFNVDVFNCLFDGNIHSADLPGAAMDVVNGDATVVTNCTFAGNALPGGASNITTVNCDANTSNFDVRNSIAYGNTPSGNNPLSNNLNDVVYSDIQRLTSHSFSGGASTTGSVDLDPKFVDAANGKFTFPRTSPCSDAGLDSYISGLTSFDITGRNRIVDVLGTTDDVNMGCYESQVIYVDGTLGTGNNNGLSWANAFQDLQPALATALAGDELWVAEDTYVAGSFRSESFVIPAGVNMYGGFTTGSETSRSQADPATNITILSGDIGTVNTKTDNSYNVVKVTDDFTTDLMMVLDGFTIKLGYADGTGATESGAGLRYENASTGTLVVSRCKFEENHADVSGGGMYLTSESNCDAIFILKDCEAIDNTAPDGAFMYNKDVEVYVANLFAIDNDATDDGGVFHAETDCADIKIAQLVATCNEADGDGNIYFSAITSGSAPLMEMYYSTLTGNGTGANATMFYGKTLSSQFGTMGYVESTVEYNNVNVCFGEVSGGTDDFAYGYSMITGSGGDDRGTSIASADPIFEDADGADDTECTADDDLRPSGTPGTVSPLIDKAPACEITAPLDWTDVDNDGNTTEALPLDFAGDDRCYDHGSVGGDASDIGAFENDGTYKGDEQSIAFETSGSVYPNPTADRITISMNNTIRQVMLFNISGQLQLAQVDFNGSQALVDMSALASGIYFVKVSDGVQTYNYKVEKL